MCHTKNGGDDRVTRRVEGGRATQLGCRLVAQQDHVCRSIGRGLHRRDRVAEHGEIDRFARVRAGRERGQAGEVPSCREPDQADALGAPVPQTANLGPQSVQWFGVANHERVAEHAGSDAQPAQPARDRLALVGHMLRVAPTGQDR